MQQSYRVIERPERDLLGEGLFWSARENAVYWTDILGKALNRMPLDGGAPVRWQVPEMIGWVIGRRDAPGLIAGLQSGFAELHIDGDRIDTRHIVDPEPHLPQNRLNDAKADRYGRIWAGSMPITADRPDGGLYRLDSDHAVRQIDEGYTVANGPAFSPGGEWLYHTDTGAGVVYRFRLEAGDEVFDRQPFIRFQPEWGKPDGMTTDAEGGLWIAHWGGARVSRFTPEGELERSISLPATQITNVTFAGEGLDRMFVTSAADGRASEPLAGALFEVDAGVRGLPTELYAG